MKPSIGVSGRVKSRAFVRAEWSLIALVYNLKRVLNRVRSGKLMATVL